ncbi:hypothetical protein [Bacillus safensis]|uniref:hypothetical protein n=1 Tax=Bacillus safensis TaxID=561879 RepID=UPI003D00A8CC
MKSVAQAREIANAPPLPDYPQAKRAGRRQRREGAKQPHAGLDPCAVAGRRTATGRPRF